MTNNNSFNITTFLADLSCKTSKRVYAVFVKL